MFVMGILAIIQMTLLPGLIFNYYYRPNGGLIFRISVTFIVSMFFNYLLIYLLTLVQLYTQAVMITVITIEVLLIIWIYRSKLKESLDRFSENLVETAKVSIRGLGQFFLDPNYPGFSGLARNLLFVLLLALSLSLIWWFFKRFTNNIGSIFNHWDAVMSWNAWAQSWAQGEIPRIKLLYPQLIPINLSIPYLLTGDLQVSFFSKSVMPLFSLLMVLVLFEFAISKRQYGYLISIVVIYLLLKKFQGDFIAEGYVDIPVAFMGLTAIIPLLRSNNFIDEKKEIVLSLLLAAAASVTKQVGLYILFIIPVIALVNGKMSRGSIRRIAILFGISLLIVVPFYIPKIIDVLGNFRNSGLPGAIAHSADVYDSEGFFKRVYLAFGSLEKYRFLFLFLIPAFFVLKKPYKLVIALIIIPYSIFWAAVASYSFRNLVLVFPLLALITGLGVEKFADFGFFALNKIKVGRLPLAVLLILLVVTVLILGLKFPASNLKTAWVEKQKNIFSNEINEQLYTLDFSGECKYVLTNYPVRYLPGLEENQVSFRYDDLGVYEKSLKKEGVCWLLVPNYSIESINKVIDASLETGEYKLLFSSEQWVPYRLIKIR